MPEELSDEEIEKIHEEAAEAALHAWGPKGAPVTKGNPYPAGSERADIWDYAYRNAYARENGY